MSEDRAHYRVNGNGHGPGPDDDTPIPVAMIGRDQEGHLLLLINPDEAVYLVPNVGNPALVVNLGLISDEHIRPLVERLAQVLLDRERLTMARGVKEGRIA